MGQQLNPHFLDVRGSVRKIIGEIDLFRFSEANLDQSQLRLVTVTSTRPEPLRIVAVDVLGDDFELFPHARFDVPLRSPSSRRRYARPPACCALLSRERGKMCDGLLGQQVGHEAVFMRPKPSRPLTNSRNFLRPFLGPLLASGVALTSWISELPPRHILIAGLDYDVALFAKRFR